MNNQENTFVTESPKKRSRSWTDWFAWAGLYLGLFILLAITQGIGIFAESLIADITGTADTALYSVASNYLPFIMCWLGLLLCCLISSKDRPIISTVTTKLKGNNLKMFAVGTGIGLATNGICILAAYLNHNIELHPGKFSIGGLIFLSVAVLIQSSAEEFFCRGFLYYKLQKRYGKPAVYIILNALFFGLVHLGNPGVTFLSVCNIIFIGIFFSLIVYFTDSLWCAFAAHAAWNFNQNIIFGLPNSGMVSDYSILSLNTETASDSWCYNVGFGVEGTFFAVIIIAVSCAAIWFYGKKRGTADRYDIWAQESENNEINTAAPVNV